MATTKTTETTIEFQADEQTITELKSAIEAVMINNDCGFITFQEMLEQINYIIHTENK